MYSDTVPEDASPGQLILQVSATDADIRSNAEITYTLLGPGAEKFTLNPDTGKDGARGTTNCVPIESCHICDINFKIRFCSYKIYSDTTKLASFRNLHRTLLYKIWGEIKKKKNMTYVNQGFKI